MTALVGSTAGTQPLMVPSSVAKRKRAGAVLPFFETAKAGVGFPTVMLKTVPVGVPVGFPETGGIVTSRGTLAPVPVYRVALPVMLSLTQNGLAVDRLNPQPFTRDGSRRGATPAWLETKSVRSYCAEALAASRVNIAVASMNAVPGIVFFMMLSFCP